MTPVLMFDFNLQHRDHPSININADSMVDIVCKLITNVYIYTIHTYTRIFYRIYSKSTETFKKMGS